MCDAFYFLLCAWYSIRTDSGHKCLWSIIRRQRYFLCSKCHIYWQWQKSRHYPDKLYTMDWPSAHVIHRIRGVWMGWAKMRYPILLRILYMVFSLLLPWNYAFVGGRDKQQNLDTFHVGLHQCLALLDRKCIFLSSITVQMEDKQRDILKD